jgi:pilus assembly protein CpaE
MVIGEQLRVIIVEDSLITVRAVRQMLDAQPDMTVVHVARTGQDGVRRALELRPDVVLMDIHLPDIDGIQAAWLIASKSPDTSIIMLTSEERTDYMQRAMMAGAQAYLLKPVRDPVELSNTIRAARRRSLERQAALSAAPGVVPATAPLAPPALGRRIALFSPKGGQGKNPLAVNLAVMLRVLTEKPVVLVDADLRFGDANVLLDLPHERSVVDILPHMDQLDSHIVDQVLVQHRSGVAVLTRPERPELADTITATHVGQLLTVLPRVFDYVVVDCELSYDEKSLAVLDRADTILLIITPSLGAVRNARHFLQLADTLGYARSKIDVIINRANSQVGLMVKDIESSLGPGRYFRLDSYGRLLTTSLNMGQPTVLSHPRSGFTRVMREIAEHVRGEPAELA